MAKSDPKPEDIVNPKPEPRDPTVVVQADIDYDRLADRVVEKLGGSLKAISDPVAELLGIAKGPPAPKDHPPAVVPPVEPPPPTPIAKKKSAGVIPWF